MAQQQINTPQYIPPSAPIEVIRTIPTPSIAPSVAASTAGDAHHLQTVQGTTLSIQERSNGFIFPQYPGKIILLQVFGKECPYCFEEMPMINNLRQRYSHRLNVIALQAQDQMSSATSQRLIQRFQMNYPIVDKNEASNLLFFIKRTYGWTGILPYTLLIKNGVTEYSFSGAINQQELEEAMQSLL